MQLFTPWMWPIYWCHFSIVAICANMRFLLTTLTCIALIGHLAMLKFLWLCNHRTILHIHLTVWLQCWSTVYQWESPFAVLQPELWHVNANLIGHNDHQVLLFYSLPGISQPCYIFYFVHMCMALLLWLCQISSFIMGAVLLHWTVTQSPPMYICRFWVPLMYKHVLVRILFVAAYNMQLLVTIWALCILYSRSSEPHKIWLTLQLITHSHGLWMFLMKTWMSSTQVLNLTLKLLQYNSKW